MDSIITAVIEKLLSLGISPDLLLLTVFIATGYFAFKEFQGLGEKIDKAQDKDNNEQKEAKIVLEKLNSLREIVSEIRDHTLMSGINEKVTRKEVERINVEIQQIKSVLNQIHGQLSVSQFNKQIK